MLLFSHPLGMKDLFRVVNVLIWKGGVCVSLGVMG